MKTADHRPQTAKKVRTYAVEVIVAIALWNTVYLENPIEQLKVEGMEIIAEELQHLSPLGWGHINLTGDYV